MKQIFVIILLAAVALGCKKETPVGPDLLDIYGPFAIKDSLSIENINGVDFSANETVKFKGDWSNITPWKITITGKTSGAVKTITGKTKTLDTLLSIWDGSSDCIFFKKEECDVQLSFGEHPNTMNCSLKINGVHDYSKDGILLKDFEGTTTAEFWGGNSNCKLDSTNKAPQGNKYYHMEGKEPGNAYWIGSFPPITAQQLFGSSTTHFPFNDKDTSTTYVNFFVRGYGYPDTYVNIQTKEDDNNNGVADTTEDSFSKRYLVTGTEWTKVSIPLSELTDDDTKGNNKKEISKISTIYIMLFSAGAARDKIGCDVEATWWARTASRAA